MRPPLSSWGYDNHRGQALKCDLAVLCLWFVGKYNKWDKVDPAELFSQAPTEKKEANPKLNMVKFLQVRKAQAVRKALGSSPSPTPIPEDICPQPGLASQLCVSTAPLLAWEAPFRLVPPPLHSQPPEFCF